MFLVSLCGNRVAVKKKSVCNCIVLCCGVIVRLQSQKISYRKSICSIAQLRLSSHDINHISCFCMEFTSCCYFLALQPKFLNLKRKKGFERIMLTWIRIYSGYCCAQSLISSRGKIVLYRQCKALNILDICRVVS